ncbi:DNA translocase FtsK [Staphylococcus nepalensis]|uniref:DNA translocase FtsK n=1 Tax=Staphylococcus nepalensis TaxID=214473 RepID=UPI003518FA5E
MSWFDKLFGDENDPNKDYLNKRNQRRQKNMQQEHKDTLLPQNNDVYERPKGKFRFPMHVIEEENRSDSAHEVSSEKEAKDTENMSNHTSSSNQKQRRRRHMYNETTSDEMKQPEASEQSTTHDETYDETNSETRRDKRQHNGKRTRIQTDVLGVNGKSSKKHEHSTPHYHKSDFKASEVPSAIFGTQKPHPLDNGVIKPKNSEEDNEIFNNDKDVQEDKTSSLESQYNEAQQQNDDDQLYQVDDEQLSSIENEPLLQNTSDQYEDTTESTTQPQKNNTINIENIYASQIVEEIRRERERKVLQKRQFKKALQQKRQENQQNDEDTIQKAIDEMYAQQAKHYIGESSLDEEQSNDISDVDDSEDISSANLTENSSHNDQNNASEFNYQEIDLDNVSSVHNIDNNQVYESLDETANPTVNLSDEPEITAMDVSQDEAGSENEQQNTSSEAESHVQQNASNLTEVDENVAISDARYRELSEAQKDMSQSTTDVDGKQNEDVEKMPQTQNEFSDDPFSTSTARDTDDNQNSTSLTDGSYSESTQDSSQFNSEEYNLSDQDIKAPSTKDNDIQTTNSSQNEADDAQVTESVHALSSSEKSSQQRKKSAITKGSKPFNVVMTPSDKKRMLDAKKKRHTNYSSMSLSEDNKYQSEDNTNIKVPSNTDKSLSSPKQQEDNIYSDQNAEAHFYDNNESTISDAQAISSDGQIHQIKDDAQQKRDTAYSNSSQSATQSQNSDNQEALSQNKSTTDDTQSVNQVDDDVDTYQGTKTAIRKGPNINLPSIDLLEEPKAHEKDNQWIEEKKHELNEAFYYFNVPAEVQTVTEGPSVTRFELSVEKGVKVSRITNLQDDIKMALAAKDIRIEAPIPGTSLVGIEVPNQSSTPVNLRSIIEDTTFKNAESKLTVAMGLRINNEPLVMDIAKTPHALIAGATGSGKSVSINSILMSLLYKNHPEELRLLLIDPKMVELAPYNGLPHLVSPVITDVKAATQSLKWAVEEMERRYKVFAKYHVRNITAFNKKANYEDRMPKIVIVIDELADLMMMAPQEVEQSIARIAQKARACGIHMLVATQRPSVNVITGLIKANIPTRIAFMVSSSVDSRTILDSGGAERLLGYGDMLYLGSGMNKPIRVQGTFVSDEEIDEVVDFIKQQRDPDYLFEEKELLKKVESQPQDDLFEDVCRFMLQEGHISTSLIQRHFQIGYNRAARIVDQLEQLGYVSGANGSKPRDVYITESDLNEN